MSFCQVPNQSSITTSMSSVVDWCSLPPELVEAISRKLTILADYIRFRAVCGAWRSSTLHYPKHLPCQFPWLLLPQSSNISHPLPFFDLANNQIHYLNLPEVTQVRYPLRLCGSSNGWLAIHEEESLSIFLFNPLTRERINLPPLSSFTNVVYFDFAQVYLIRRPDAGDSSFCKPDSFIKKIVLSRTPGSSFVALAVIKKMNVLAYFKSGDSSWKYIEETRSFTEDVTCFNGLFYAINTYGEIVVCDLNGDSPVVEFILTPRPTLGASMQHLVNSMDGLLLVAWFLEDSDDFEQVMDDSRCEISNDFRLFKLDFDQKEWEETTGLGNMVLFLGNISSIAIKASDFPGCKGNRIYYLEIHFLNDLSKPCYYNVDRQVGFLDLDDRSCDRLPRCPSKSNSQYLGPSPVWFTPNPC